MYVPGREHQLVLNTEGGEPKIICWGWVSLLSEPFEEICIVMGRPVIGEENPNSRLAQESGEHGRVLLGFGPAERKVTGTFLRKGSYGTTLRRLARLYMAMWPESSAMKTEQDGST